MKLHVYQNRIEQLDQLFRMKATGTPKELALRLELSVSQLYEYLDFMKSGGAPISYNKNRKTFCYTEEGQFYFGFYKKII